LAHCDRDSIVVATKVGYTLVPDDGGLDEKVFHRFDNVPAVHPVFDYSYDGIMRTFEGSLQRLNLSRVDILNIHDPDDHWEEAIETVYPALHRLRDEGVVRAIGVGMNQAEMLARFAREGDFDCLLLAGRYTLIDHTGLRELLPVCERKRISVIIGGPYNSGIRRRCSRGWQPSKRSVRGTRSRCKRQRCSFPWRTPRWPRLFRGRGQWLR
jgi:D-threo-aldose 1-dehydrogenase